MLMQPGFTAEPMDRPNACPVPTPDPQQPCQNHVGHTACTSLHHSSPPYARQMPPMARQVPNSSTAWTTGTMTMPMTVTTTTATWACPQFPTAVNQLPPAA